MPRSVVHESIRKLFPTVLDPVRLPLARVYALALYEAAERKGELDRVREELRALVEELLPQKPDVERLLLAPAISPTRKAEFIERAFSGRIAATLLNFLLVLNRRQRLELLRTIVEQFFLLYDERQGIRDVYVELAFEPDEPLRRTIEERLSAWTGATPRVHFVHAPEILGGLIIRLDYRVFDGSVRTQLERLKHRIRERSRHEIQSRRDRLHS